MIYNTIHAFFSITIDFRSSLAASQLRIGLNLHPVCKNTSSGKYCMSHNVNRYQIKKHTDFENHLSSNLRLVMLI